MGHPIRTPFPKRTVLACNEKYEHFLLSNWRPDWVHVPPPQRIPQAWCVSVCCVSIRVLTLGEVLGDFNNVLLGEKKEVAVGLGSHCASTWNIMDQVHLHTYSGGLKYNARDILFVTSPKRLPSFMTATTSPSPETTCSTQCIQYIPSLSQTVSITEANT